MEITQALKTEIYHTLADFLEAYKAEDTQVLAEKFDISGEFLEEIYEITTLEINFLSLYFTTLVVKSLIINHASYHSYRRANP